MAGSNTYAYPTHANTQEYCCATHVMYVLHTQTARAVCTPLYTPTYTGDGRDLYRRNAGGRSGSMAGSNTYAHPTHANTQEYCCATHVMYVLHTDSDR